MTCIEKLRQEHPDDIPSCPSFYGYLDKPAYCSKSYILGPAVCDICWSREIPEERTDAE